MTSAIRTRHPYFFFLSLVTILAELGLPVTLSHVPFSKVVTWETQVVCAWLSIGILGLMILVVAFSFAFVRLKGVGLPVDPRTVVGGMYYVCESRGLLGVVDGLERMGREERDLEVRYVRERYWFGWIGGVGGRARVGVEVLGEKSGIV